MEIIAGEREKGIGFKTEGGVKSDETISYKNDNCFP